jgi:hypothetical protein
MNKQMTQPMDQMNKQMTQPMDQMNKQMDQPVYRFKFTEDFVIKLMEFSRIHRFEDAVTFKDNWGIWCDTNSVCIDLEIESLKKKGYNGNCKVKMFKSVRYYFKNKSSIKKAVKKRRQYIGLDPDFRDAIDEHVEVAIRRELNPRNGYIDFMDSTTYTDIISAESLRLEACDFNKKEILEKLKKTYKNRYFNMRSKV